ncbi:MULTISPECIES: mannose-1-phosphate guanylyltransferase/mannose-6-phosphate isomerase [unclassified Methylophaga]|jgi:mannose-1-phosphate guanylyltransferase|uniref:mannose-1-phosphate guanylyltransferase/mannose-6-phosphate isomerase n=1 Tax=unclassified Methylophaga TaxID=2629249 RepID=UPI000C4F00AC|nr:MULTISPECIES: mannose-1-phosphate guanylyltransferase/mannose-6-phosphate isomerase [unclassified Methylophaga]MAL48905.1 mannose-1-phosphate guanylyltransferase/mannose-6-phosphate isomerase [Methylophaga sp.]MBP25458.1 mannose-1-phosphate guanylyltransferase/mannose-6-phosphate isomerase [Methylophaga sp.]HCC82655.1 mannose-1-phosphate guanylyltransferase/mannose-6-phosphate isomerase [Methylophaga sp.]|tara:strand:- start:37681 stop:39081 length:1401 start_codon:yes stop_codon:yes gene_type:complete
MIPVILSGGSGSRLWPLSRKNKPKQFLTLFGDSSMFQSTLTRLNGLESLEAPLIVCNNEHRFMVAEQLQEIGLEANGIILEPCARNTAPAIALAALKAMENGEDPLLLILAADHLISDVAVFHKAIQQAQILAEQDKLVTFGIQPQSAHTGYGYIEAEEKSKPSSVKRFIEKPDLATAESYLSAGNFFWNSGMFLFKASAYIKELARFSPEMLSSCKQSLEKAVIDLDFVRVDPELFEQSPSDSIDYAVMEKTDKAMVVPLDAGWSDVGSWSSLWEAFTRDADQNVLIGDVLVENVHNAYIHSENRLVTVLGLDDVIVVETHDAVMVAHKDQAQKVKTIVEELTRQNRKEVITHRKCYRPWGNYDSVDMGDRFQVKRILVNPGASLSLQMHYHRAEHWVVVSGTAEVTRDDEVMLLGENESTFIPLGSVHRLRNPGRVPLEIIEVQSGAYLEEDDIIRLQDTYNRK